MAISKQADQQAAQQLGLAHDDTFDLGDHSMQSVRRIDELRGLRGFAHEVLRLLPGRVSVARPPLG